MRPELPLRLGTPDGYVAAALARVLNDD